MVKLDKVQCSARDVSGPGTGAHTRSHLEADSNLWGISQINHAYYICYMEGVPSAYTFLGPSLMPFFFPFLFLRAFSHLEADSGLWGISQIIHVYYIRYMEGVLSACTFLGPSGPSCPFSSHFFCAYFGICRRIAIYGEYPK